MSDQRGWFAEFDDEVLPGRWRPVLQLDGHAPDFDVWFQTKPECEDWIRANVIGRTMLDDHVPALLSPGGSTQLRPGETHAQAMNRLTDEAARDHAS
jgi:hypothetical protein